MKRLSGVFRSMEKDVGGVSDKVTGVYISVHEEGSSLITIVQKSIPAPFDVE